MTAHTPSRMPNEPHDNSRPMPHHTVPYFAIFGVLVALTIVTVGIAFYRFSNELLNVALALLVATIKGACVALFFMHLKFEGKLIYLMLLVPICLMLILVFALIPDIVMTDPASTSGSLHLFNPHPAIYVPR
jgi:cytochrome c oxidase subunit IV